MDASKEVFIANDGAITLPQEVLLHYGLSENIPVRIVETRCGILLVPLTDEPMSEALLAELEEWQSLVAESLESVFSNSSLAPKVRREGSQT
ncbi:MAG: AbrB/MazE/SpoVT family DNA-binding domain-containing protein [Acidobacteriota bacterium]